MVAAGDLITADDFLAELNTLQGEITALQGIVTNQSGGHLASLTEVADQLIANSSANFASTGVAFNTAAGRRVKVTWTGRISSSLAGDSIDIKLFDDDTSTQLAITQAYIGANDAQQPGALMTVVYPPAGAHTYRIYVSRPFGSGTGGFRSGAVLLIEDIGAV